MKKIAIASCQKLPSFEKDDRFLFAALEKEGIEAHIHPWDADVDWSLYDICLIRTTWDYVPRWNEFIRWARTVSHSTLLINSPEIINWNVNKLYLRELSQKGVPIAPTIWCTEEIDIQKNLIEKGWNRGFLKPVIGACASDTLRFSIEEAAHAQEFLQQNLKRHPMILQPYIKTVEEEGEYSTFYFGDTCTHFVQKVPPKGDYRVQDDFGAQDFAIKAIPELQQLAQQALQHIPYPWLYARIDALRMSDGTWVLNELEMIEPSLFFRHAPDAAQILVQQMKIYHKNHAT